MSSLFVNSGNLTERQEDLAKLYYLCENEGNSFTWEDDVREWLRNHNETDIEEAALLQDGFRVGTLHQIIKNEGSLDIIDTIIEKAPTSVTQQDKYGRLPLHYAANLQVQNEVLEMLINAYKKSATVRDLKGRTPLHCALLNNKTRAVTLECVKTLSPRDPNPNYITDDSGLLPLHYALLFSCSLDIFRVLVESYGEDKITKATSTDEKAKTPLHFVCSNAANSLSADIATYLINEAGHEVDVTDAEGNTPLRLLARSTSSITDTTNFNVTEKPTKILELLLRSKPEATAEFLTDLQALPDWLRDRAVVMPYVQNMLNKKISNLFPTFILLSDFYFYVTTIVSFSLGITRTIEIKAEPCLGEGMCPDELTCSGESLCTYMVILAVCSAYFLLRELTQILSLMSLGLFKTWLHDAGNWLDVVTILLGLFFAGDMYKTVNCPCASSDELDRFRWTASIALLIFWSAILTFLKSTFIDFAVFVGGLYNVLSRLVAFLIALSIIVVAFTQVFVIIYFDSDRCTQSLSNSTDSSNATCYEDEYEVFNYFCNREDAFIKVYTMLIGEVNDADFLLYDEAYKFEENLGIISFALFMLLMVILLANVLIAIVTDSYGVIKNERAAIVFWSNRLDFVAEMDVIWSGPWQSNLRKLMFMPEERREVTESSLDNFGRDLWDRLIHDSEYAMRQRGEKNTNLFYFFLRSVNLTFVIFIWLPLGLCTAGLLWPPQVRAYVFNESLTRMEKGEKKELERRTVEIRALQDEVRDLQNQIILEMRADRDEVVAMKAKLMEMKEDLQNEVKDIKRIVISLFDLQSSEGVANT